MITESNLVNLGFKKIYEVSHGIFNGVKCKSRKDFYLGKNKNTTHISLINNESVYLWKTPYWGSPYIRELSEEQLINLVKYYNNMHRDPETITYAEYLRSLKQFKDFLYNEL